MMNIAVIAGLVLSFAIGYVIDAANHKEEIKALKETHEREMETVKRIWKASKN